MYHRCVTRRQTPGETRKLPPETCLKRQGGTGLQRARFRHPAAAGTLGLLAAAVSLQVCAGPPYFSDDPEPTDRGHYEIYLFTEGVDTRAGTSGDSGIDFNYGGGEDLQLTAVLPVDYDNPRHAPDASGVGNVELAAKYRFLHKDALGWDVAVFPRLTLPSASRGVGDQHASFFLPLWVERDWDEWSMFGGGGCTLNRGDDARDFCEAGWAVTHQITPTLQLGAELAHQGADTRDGHAATRVGVGLRYDLSENYHLLFSAGPGLEHAADTGRYDWYLSLLLTY